MSTEGVPVVGDGVPASALRVGILVVGLAVMSVPLLEGATVSTLVLLSPLVLASAYAPASPAPAGVVVVAAVLVAFAGGDPLRAGVLVLVPSIHLFHVLCGLAAVLPAAGRVHLTALRAPALRFLTIQAVLVGVVVVAAFLPAGRTAPLLETGALAGLVVIAGLVLWRQRVR